MTPPPKKIYIHKSIIPQKYSFFQKKKTQNIKIHNFETSKMVWAYVFMKILVYTPCWDVIYLRYATVILHTYDTLSASYCRSDQHAYNRDDIYIILGHELFFVRTTC